MSHFNREIKHYFGGDVAVGGAGSRRNYLDFRCYGLIYLLPLYSSILQRSIISSALPFPPPYICNIIFLVFHLLNFYHNPPSSLVFSLSPLLTPMLGVILTFNSSSFLFFSYLLLPQWREVKTFLRKPSKITSLRYQNSPPSLRPKFFEIIVRPLLICIHIPAYSFATIYFLLILTLSYT